MFGSKKKQKLKGLPDLPPSMTELPNIKDYNPEFSHEEHEPPHGLPSFPDSPMQKGFSQSAIKDAVDSPDPKDLSVNLPELPSFQEGENPNTTELEEWTPQLPSPPTAQLKLPPPSHNLNKPIFVKLDKFKDAKESLENIKSKLIEMEELLKIVKDLKAKENQELTQWETEVEKIKARINSINSDIFENAY
jgi:hypothetical protein